jgi:hypothetical protein
MGFPMSISLTVNGETRRIASGATVADLVADIGLNPPRSRSNAMARSPRARLWPMWCWARVTFWKSCILWEVVT